MASLAAKAGVTAYVFYPSNLKKGKARACRALGAAVCQLDSNSDQANRACRELALTSGIQFANITLHPVYAEGAKTMACRWSSSSEWRSPDHVVVRAARRDALLPRVRQGPERAGSGRPRRDFANQDQRRSGRRLWPVATAIVAPGGEWSPSRRIRQPHSLAIGVPGDGPLVVDAVMSRGGSAATATDSEIFDAIDLLGATEGILTEPAGGTTVASTIKLANEGKPVPTTPSSP